MLFDYIGFENDYEVKVIKSLFKKYKRLFPYWVYEVRVSKCYEDAESQLAVEMCPEYRQLILSVYPLFFSYNKDKRQRIFLHEIVHMVLGRLSCWIDNRICDDEVLKEEFRERLESTIQELTFILEKNLCED